jgi:hypothetical protein
MFRRILSVGAGALFTAALAIPQQATQPNTQKKPKDAEELRLYTAVSRESDPARKIPLLDQWNARYPESDYRQERNLYYISCYSTMESNAMRSNAPDDAISAGAAAARAMLAKASAMFAVDMKPPAVKPDDWKTAWDEAVLDAHVTLASIALNRRSYPEAEAEYLAILAEHPSDAATAFRMGSAIVSERDTARYPEAIYYLARSVTITGAGALNDSGKQTTETYLEKIYLGYHGDLSGVDDVKKVASQSPALPANWKIQSVQEISQDRIAAAEQFAKDHPDIVLWRSLKERLIAADGETYFADSVKDRELPPLKGTVAAQPDAKMIVVAIEEAGSGEITLKLDSALRTPVPPGTAIEFVGVPESFANAPFMVTMTAERGKITVLP